MIAQQVAADPKVIGVIPQVAGDSVKRRFSIHSPPPAHPPPK